MKTAMLVISCCMLIASLCVAVKQIKAKKPVTDLYLILSLLTFLIALRTVLRLIGG